MRSLQRLFSSPLLSLIPVENRTPQQLYCRLHTTPHQHCSRRHFSDGWGNTYNPDIQPSEMKSVRVAIIGSPNVGKSTLLNSLMKQYISPVSTERKTTTGAVHGVITHDELQVVFVDTPGLLPAELKFMKGHKKRVEVEEYLSCQDKISTVVEHADCAVVLFDSSLPVYKSFITRDLAAILDTMPHIPKILVLNKIDKPDGRERAKIELIIEQLTRPLQFTRPVLVPSVATRCDVEPPVELEEDIVDGREFEDIISCSAISGTNIEYIWRQICKCAVPRPWEFEPDTVSPDEMETVVTNLVRSEVLTKTNQGYKLDHKFVGVREEEEGKLFIDHALFTKCPLFKDREDRQDSEANIGRVLQARFGVPVEFNFLQLRHHEKKEFVELTEGEEPTIQVIEDYRTCK